jgi:hypothetical protein
MNKIIKDVYTYYTHSPEEEIELTKNFFKNEKILSSSKIDKQEDILETTNKFLTLPIYQQIHILHCILDTMYSFSDDKDIIHRNSEKFLAQSVFNELRNVIFTIVNLDLTKEEQAEKISVFENKLGIKIVDSKT